MSLVRAFGRFKPRLILPLQQGIGHPLDPGHFELARMPMNLVYPRPDIETQSIAHHRKFHGAMRYRIPIGIQGGAWPFKYEITTGPVFATIGETYGATNYGIIDWTPTGETGTVDFTVRVTDSELNTVDVTWTVERNDAGFVFVDSNTVTSGTGTIGDPLKTWADWYKNSNADATYANQTCVFRTGTYTAVGDPSNDNALFQSGVKNQNIVAFPGESVTVNCSGCKLNMNNMADITVIGIRWLTARQDVDNAHFWWLKNQIDRICFFENTFEDFGPGLVGTDNNCAIFVSARAGIKQYGLIKKNRWTNIWNGSSSNGAYCDFYDFSNLLIEGNTADNANSSYGWWCKGTTENVSIRANLAFDNCDGRQACIQYGTESALLPHDHEVCWNLFVIPFTDTGQDVLLWANSSAWANQTYDSYIYRNTFVGGRVNLRFAGASPFFETDTNVVVNNNLSFWDTAIQTTVNANLTGSSSAGIVDANGNLIGAYLAQLGLIGRQVQ